MTPPTLSPAAPPRAADEGRVAGPVGCATLPAPKTAPTRWGSGTGAEAAGAVAAVTALAYLIGSIAGIARTVLACAFTAAAVYIDFIAGGEALAAWALPAITLH